MINYTYMAKKTNNIPENIQYLYAKKAKPKTNADVVDSVLSSSEKLITLMIEQHDLAKKSRSNVETELKKISQIVLNNGVKSLNDIVSSNNLIYSSLNSLNEINSNILSNILGISKSLGVQDVGFLLPEINVIPETDNSINDSLNEITNVLSAINSNTSINDSNKYIKSSTIEPKFESINDDTIDKMNSLMATSVSSGMVGVSEMFGKYTTIMTNELKNLATNDQTSSTFDVQMLSLDSMVDGFKNFDIKKLFDKDKSEEHLAFLKNFENIDYRKIVDGLSSIEEKFKNLSEYEKAAEALNAVSKSLSELHLPSLKDMLGLAAGLAAIGLSIGYVISNITWEDLGKFAALMGGLYLMSKKGKQLNELGKTMLYLGGGLAAISLSMLAWSDVSWEDVTQMSVSLGVIGLFGKVMKKSKFDISDAAVLGVLGASIGVLGLGVSTFSDIKMSNVGVMGASLGVVGLFAYAMDKAKLNIADTATLGVLGLSLIALGYGVQSFKDVSIEDVGVMGASLGVVGTFAFLMDKANLNIADAATLGVLGLSLIALGYGVQSFKDVSIEDVGVMATSLGVVGTFAFLLDKANVNIADAATLGVLGLSLISLGYGVQSFKDVTMKDVGVMAVTLGVVGTFAFLLDKANINIADAATLGVLGLSLIALGYGVQSFKDVTMKDVGVAMAVSGGMAAIAFLISKVGVSNILLGSLGIAAMGGALYVLGMGITKMTELDISLEQVGVIAALIGGTGLAFSGIGLLSAPILLGAAAIGGMSIALMGLVSGMNSVMKADLSIEATDRFKENVFAIKDVFFALGDEGGVLKLTSGLAQAGLLSVSTLALAGTMHMLSKTTMPTPEQINGLSFGVIGLKDAFTQFGIVDSAKLLAATPVMIALATTSVAVGGAINLFTKLSADESDVQAAIYSFDSFVTGLASTFLKYDNDEFKKIKNGVKSMLGINTLMSEIAMGVKSMGNLEFKKYDDEGNLIGMQQFTEEDFAKVGDSVGYMINALTDPLSNIASQKESFSIGSFKITNPFSNKVKKGIDSLTEIGSVFNPLMNILKTYSETDMSDEFINRFQTNTASMLNSIGTIFSSDYIDIDGDVLEVTGEATELISTFINNINGENVEIGANNLMKVASSLKLIREELKNTDIEKLIKMSDFMITINNLNENDKIEDLSVAILKLIDELSDRTETSNNNNSKTIIHEKTIMKESPNDYKNDDMIKIIGDSNESIANKLTEVVNVLEGTLKVIQI